MKTKQQILKRANEIENAPMKPPSMMRFATYGPSAGPCVFRSIAICVSASVHANAPENNINVAMLKGRGNGSETKTIEYKRSADNVMCMASNIIVKHSTQSRGKKFQHDCYWDRYTIGLALLLFFFFIFCCVVFAQALPFIIVLSRLCRQCE